VLMGAATASAAICLVTAWVLRSTWEDEPAAEGVYAVSSSAGPELPASTARSASV
jgi:hypothetical protein